MDAPLTVSGAGIAAAVDIGIALLFLIIALVGHLHWLGMPSREGIQRTSWQVSDILNAEIGACRGAGNSRPSISTRGRNGSEPDRAIFSIPVRASSRRTPH